MDAGEDFSEVGRVPDLRRASVASVRAHMHRKPRRPSGPPLQAMHLGQATSSPNWQGYPGDNPAGSDRHPGPEQEWDLRSHESDTCTDGNCDEPQTTRRRRTTESTPVQAAEVVESAQNWHACANRPRSQNHNAAVLRPRGGESHRNTPRRAGLPCWCSRGPRESECLGQQLRCFRRGGVAW